MDIIEKIKIFVEEECKKPTSKYGYEPFPNHFVPMVNYAEQLAEKLNADKEIVIISAWLHDIGSIIHGRKDHHITGSKIAEQKLRELNYSQEKIELVKKCIKNHRGSQNNTRLSKEEQIIAEADAISNFDNIIGIINAAIVFENQTQQQAKKSTLEKLERKWNQLKLEESKNLVKDKYQATKLLFS